MITRKKYEKKTYEYILNIIIEKIKMVNMCDEEEPFINVYCKFNGDIKEYEFTSDMNFDKKEYIGEFKIPNPLFIISLDENFISKHNWLDIKNVEVLIENSQEYTSIIKNIPLMIEKYTEIQDEISVVVSDLNNYLNYLGRVEFNLLPKNKEKIEYFTKMLKEIPFDSNESLTLLMEDFEKEIVKEIKVQDFQEKIEEPFSTVLGNISCRNLKNRNLYDEFKRIAQNIEWFLMGDNDSLIYVKSINTLDQGEDFFMVDRIIKIEQALDFMHQMNECGLVNNNCWKDKNNIIKNISSKIREIIEDLKQ